MHEVFRHRAVIAALGLLTAAACSQSPLTAPNIVRFGPRTVRSGVVFNKQKDGNAALWVGTSNPMDRDAAILLNGEKLRTAHGKPEIATAEVPAALYSQPGTYPLQIVENVDGRVLKSNVVQFIVKPQ